MRERKQIYASKKPVYLAYLQTYLQYYSLALDDLKALVSCKSSQLFLRNHFRGSLDKKCFLVINICSRKKSFRRHYVFGFGVLVVIGVVVVVAVAVIVDTLSSLALLLLLLPLLSLWIRYRYCHSCCRLLYLCHRHHHIIIVASLSSSLSPASTLLSPLSLLLLLLYLSTFSEVLSCNDLFLRGSPSTPITSLFIDSSFSSFQLLKLALAGIRTWICFITAYFSFKAQ